MARKYNEISELYKQTLKKIVSSPQNWEAFLRSACRNYKLRFDEQVLIFAQRPDVTAVLEIEQWNRWYDRWVNRGTTGIAVFEDNEGRRKRLKYYFDISDTHPGRNSAPVPLWKMREEYTQEVTAALENSFGALEDTASFPHAVLSAAKNAVKDNLPNYLSEFQDIAKKSGFTEESAEYFFRNFVQDSVVAMLLTRFGIDPATALGNKRFEGIELFEGEGLLRSLGVATGDIAGRMLSVVSRTILSLNRQKTIAKNLEKVYNTDTKPNRKEKSG